MLSTRHRFHGRSSLRHVQAHGQTVRGPNISLKYAATKRNAGYRAAVIVSRKVHSSAVVRNRIRRRIFTNLRVLAPNCKGAFDIVLIVYSQELATIPASQLSAEIAGLLTRANILNSSPKTHYERDIIKPRES